ncbi:Acyl-CoA-binding protein, ACBP [Parasponia andersonii]|uniref:Acyl-CoA-binding protein, ACBP n=1 Tax=Parasponia andersonii TaxID=3476 RepID=A0A2P5D0B4_PARAD|nr:Acyl-CoA-binding protein, ACBP [Parasponia andersonii]
MTPEVAMEQYISLLSECVPGWMQDAFGEDDKQDFIDAWEFGKLDVLKTLVNYQPVVARDERTNNNWRLYACCPSPPWELLPQQ